MIKLWFRYSFDFFTSYYQKNDLTTLNTGFADPEQIDGVFLKDVRDRFDIYRIQLYHYLVKSFGNIESMAGASILETGCGRGGGLNYIAKTFTPDYALGIDISQR